MAQLDVNGVVRQARTGAVPPGWYVYPLRAVTAWTPVVLSPLLVALFIGGGIYTIATFLSDGEIFAPEVVLALFGNSDTGLLIIWLVEVVLFFGLGVLMLVFGILSLRPALRRGEYLLIITPEGLVEARGAKVKAAAFSDVTRMVLTNNGAALAVGLRDRKPLTINIGAYGKAQEIYGLTLAAARAGTQAGR